MGSFREILGERVRTARKRLGLTQKELAEQAGIAVHQILSQIEKGQREVKAWELAALAKALKTDFSSLLADSGPQQAPVVLWREYPTEAREVIEANFLQRCQQYATLEQLAEEVTQPDLPTAKVESAPMTFGAAKRLARRASKELDLGSRPATALEGVLEDGYGVKIWYEDLGEEGSAASTIGPFGYAVLMNSAEAPWRRNFSLAHELFHLLTWQSILIDRLLRDAAFRHRIEQLANAFASSLLLPQEPLVDAFESRTKNDIVQYIDLVEVAREFGVSTDALLYRLLDLRCLDKETVESLRANSAFRALDRSTMRARWQRPVIPERFVRLAFAAYQKGRLSRARLAQYLDTSLIDLTETLLEYGLDDRENYKTEVRTARC